MDTTDIQKVIREYYEQLYTTNWIKEMGKFLESYNLPRLKQEIENLNRLISSRRLKQ